MKIKTIYNLKVGDECYHVDSYGDIYHCVIDDYVTNIDENGSTIQIHYLEDLINGDSIRLTYEECKNLVKYRKALAKVKRAMLEANGDWVADWDNHKQVKYSLSCVGERRELQPNPVYSRNIGGFVFKDKAAFWNAISLCEDEFKFIICESTPQLY